MPVHLSPALCPHCRTTGLSVIGVVAFCGACDLAFTPYGLAVEKERDGLASEAADLSPRNGSRKPLAEARRQHARSQTRTLSVRG